MNYDKARKLLEASWLRGGLTNFAAPIFAMVDMSPFGECLAMRADWSGSDRYVLFVYGKGDLAQKPTISVYLENPRNSLLLSRWERHEGLPTIPRLVGDLDSPSFQKDIMEHVFSRLSNEARLILEGKYWPDVPMDWGEYR